MFCHNVLPAIFLEQCPFVRVVPRLVPGPSPVALCRLAGYAEIPDQRLADRQLLLVLRQANRFACCVQAGRIAAIQPMRHGAAPLIQRRCISGPVKAIPFECRVVGVLNYIGVPQGLFPYLWWK